MDFNLPILSFDMFVRTIKIPDFKNTSDYKDKDFTDLKTKQSIQFCRF